MRIGARLYTRRPTSRSAVASASASTAPSRLRSRASVRVSPATLPATSSSAPCRRATSTELTPRSPRRRATDAPMPSEAPRPRPRARSVRRSPRPRTLRPASASAGPDDRFRSTPVLTVGDRNPENAAVAGAPPPMGTVTTAAELFLRNAERDDVAAHFEDRSYTYRELAAESLRRAALWEPRYSARPPHIGVLLDNTPEYLFWLGAAADQPLGNRRHQRHLPRRRTRAPDRPLRLSGARDLGRPTPTC